MRIRDFDRLEDFLEPQISPDKPQLNKTNNQSKHKSSIELELTDSELEYGFNT